MSTNSNNKVSINAKKAKKPSAFYRFLGYVGRFLMKCVWWPTKIYYKEKFPKDSKVICICNHYAIEDADAIYHQLFDFKGRIVIKSEAMKEGFFNKFLSALCNAISVRRGESDITAVKEMLKELNSGGRILIFPEGTRNKSKDYKTMLPFKYGPATIALKSKALIVPTLYYKPLKPFGFSKNRLIVGDPIDLSAFYGRPAHECKEEINQIIVKSMQDLRVQIDEIVEKFDGNLQAYEQYKFEQYNNN